jgi:hypothetical protein
VKRVAAALDRTFSLHVSLANHDELLVDYLIEIPAGMAELPIEAPAHITDVIVEAFGPTASWRNGWRVPSFRALISASPLWAGPTDCRKYSRARPTAMTWITGRR